MNPKFHDITTTQAAAYLLKKRGGAMSYMKLIKLLYLVDREALLRWGRPVTFDRYVSMKNGIVLSNTYDLILDNSLPGSEYWSKHISAPSDYEITLMKEPPFDELSQMEIGLIDEIFLNYGACNRWELVEKIHELPEWIDPDHSAIRVEYKDILTAAGKTDSEVQEILHELDGIALADLHFS